MATCSALEQSTKPGFYTSGKFFIIVHIMCDLEMNRSKLFPFSDKVEDLDVRRDLNEENSKFDDKSETFAHQEQEREEPSSSAMDEIRADEIKDYKSRDEMHQFC